MKQQRGFSLIMAIFILVVVGLLGIYMVRINGVQKQTGNFALLDARAYQAARAGIEWSIATITSGGNCTQINAQTAMTFTGLANFTVKLSCSVSSYSEAISTENVYSINALSQYKTYSAADYVARQINVAIVH